jgi:hypothetical protein
LFDLKLYQKILIPSQSYSESSFLLTPCV